jgi:glycine betaine/choline ABC-type transport system substrate-binding protein
MDRTKAFACLITGLLLGGCRSSDPLITVGSKNFTEQVVLGEIIAQHIENRLHQKISRKLNLGGTLLAHQALTSGQIDLYPEYTGTAAGAILKIPGADLDRIRSEYQQHFHLEWLDPLGINNSFAMVIRGPMARERGLLSLSDAARAPQPWKLGAGYEFEQRADGLAALKNTYQLRFDGAPRTMDLGLLYQALDQKQVDMIAANATDGLLSKLDVRVLADDRHAFPPYEVCIVARQDRLQQVPGLRSALAELSSKFSNQVMQKVNYQVDGEHRPAAQVATDFLRNAGL